MTWDKEKEAQRILAKEKAVNHTYVKHKDGRMPTPKIVIGYAKEDDLLVDCMTWAKNSYLKELYKRIYHTANENDEGFVTGTIKKAKGVLAGVYDVTFVKEGGLVIWAEFKLPGEDFSPAQKELLFVWEPLGHKPAFIDNFSDWRRWIEIDCLGHKFA